MDFKIWVDSADKDKADWLKKYTKLGALDAKVETLHSNVDFPKNPRLIQDVLYLGKPDILLTHTQGVLEIPSWR